MVNKHLDSVLKVELTRLTRRRVSFASWGMCVCVCVCVTKAEEEFGVSGEQFDVTEEVIPKCFLHDTPEWWAALCKG